MIHSSILVTNCRFTTVTPCLTFVLPIKVPKFPWKRYQIFLDTIQEYVKCRKNNIIVDLYHTYFSINVKNVTFEWKSYGFVLCRNEKFYNYSKK